MSSYSVPLVTPANTVLLRKSPVTSSGLGSLFHWSLQQTQYCYCAIFPAVDEFVLGSTGHSSKHSTATEITRYVIRAGKLVPLVTPANTVLLPPAIPPEYPTPADHRSSPSYANHLTAPRRPQFAKTIAERHCDPGPQHAHHRTTRLAAPPP